MGNHPQLTRGREDVQTPHRKARGCTDHCGVAVLTTHVNVYLLITAIMKLE